MPVPICTNANVPASRPCPCSRSASAAASTSFSMTSCSPNAARSSASTDGLPQAARTAGQREGIAARVIDAWAADHGLGERRPVDPRHGAQLVGETDQLGQPAAGARRPGPESGAGHHLAGQVSDRAAQVLAADVEAEHQPGVRPDLVQQGGPAGHAGALARLPDQSGPLDVGQCQRHGRLGQPGQPGQVGPRAPAQPADVLQQELLVQRPEQLRPGRLAGPQLPWRLLGRPEPSDVGRPACRPPAQPTPPEPM